MDSFSRRVSQGIVILGILLIAPVVFASYYLKKYYIYRTLCNDIWLYCALVVGLTGFCGICVIILGVVFAYGKSFRNCINSLCKIIPAILFLALCIWGMIIRQNMTSNCSHSEDQIMLNLYIFFEICFWYIITIMIALIILFLCLIVFCLRTNCR